MRNHVGLAAMLPHLLALLLLASPAAAAETFSPAPVPGSGMQAPSAPGGQSAMEVMPAFFPPWSPDFSDGFLPGSTDEDVDDEDSAPAPGVDLTVPIQ
jgi:hypothetical protein